MLDSLVVPLLVTTDLPPDADLAEFGRVLADAVRAPGRGGVSYEGFLYGGVFWLDPPRVASQSLSGGEPRGRFGVVEELRFAALIGYLSVCGEHGSVKDVVGDAGRAITGAVAARYGDLGSPPAVMAVRAVDVRERTPPSAVFVRTADAVPELVAVTRSYL
ncbi:hypothetical protein AB0395_36245 [Streptosporangium sp. NPDC051023]|uniref:hypothetical protein n=1 Tax=Streptosporangium sp. NPDC051023 TaxID=3155410 RepID=UPI00344B1455